MYEFSENNSIARNLVQGERELYARKFEYRPEDFRAKEFRAARRVQRAKLAEEERKKKRNMIISLSLVAALGIGYTGVVTHFQHQSFAEANTVVATGLVRPELNPNGMFDHYEVLKSGEVFLVDKDGNKSSALNDISAEEIAKMSGYEGEVVDREAAARKFNQ